MNHESIRPPEVVGGSDAFLQFQEGLSAVAKIDRPVIITGERGTGKESAALRLHYLSPRWQQPLVALNCAALAPSLQESELFGHEAGAFTGAVGRRRGRFEQAGGGTLFLDEIGAMDLRSQEKILRAVEYGVIERLGGGRPMQVDVRIVAATNKDLPAAVRNKEFLPDLLDRLSFEVLTLPPLREREGDIMLLARHFAARMAVEIGLREVPAFSRSAAAILTSYAWPGNVRELKNAVERAVVRAEAGVIEEIVVNPFASSYGCTLEVQAAQGESADQGGGAEASEGVVGRDVSFDEAIKELELRMLRENLQRARYNQSRAAELMGMSYDRFRGLYRKYKEEL